MRTSRIVIHIAALLLLALAGRAAYAGGDDYDAANENEAAGPSYFGFVWDQRGWPLADARVVLKPKVGKPVEVKTNVLGLYRSHVNKDVRPEDVEVSCEKAGHKPSRIVRRKPSAGPPPTVQIDCILQRL